jgi:membrane protein DedA with SNARE-associated domain
MIGLRLGWDGSFPVPSPGLLASPHPECGRRLALLAIFTDFVTHQVAQYGYVAVFVLMVLESACVPIPSEVTMLFGGALTTTAFAGAGNELSLFWVALIGTAGNLVGSWLAYWAGYAGGRPFIDRWGSRLMIRPQEIDRAHEWFERRGDAAVFLSRLVPVVRTFISLPAGVARMPFWKFSLYTVLGCLPWTFALAWLGAMLGERWHVVEDVLRPVAWLVAIACVTGIAWWVRRRRRDMRTERKRSETESDALPPGNG